MPTLLVLLLSFDEKEIAKLLAEKDESLRAKNAERIYERGPAALPALFALAAGGGEPVRERARGLRDRVVAGYAEAALDEKAALHRIRIYLFPRSCLCSDARIEGLSEAVRLLRGRSSVLGAHAGEALLAPEAVVVSVFLSKEAVVRLSPIRAILEETLRVRRLGWKDEPLPASFFDEAVVYFELLGRGDCCTIELPSGQKVGVTDRQTGAAARAVLRFRGFRWEPRAVLPRPRE
ncbi:MAG: hypothetical protein HYY17_06050 [Planctomycetes bacterium]|nr:hypothetical protein [Planctomycetota bacterium]